MGGAEMHDFGRRLSVPADFLAWCAGLLIVVMMVHVAADVFARLVFRTPIDGTIEWVAGYYMVAVVFFPLAYVSRGEGHILIELFTSKLPARGRAALDCMGATLTFVYVGLMAWQTGIEAIEQTEGHETWETADSLITIWPSRWLLPIGCATMAIYFAWLIAEYGRRTRSER